VPVWYGGFGRRRCVTPGRLQIHPGGSEEMHAPYLRGPGFPGPPLGLPTPRSSVLIFRGTFGSSRDRSSGDSIMSTGLRRRQPDWCARIIAEDSSLQSALWTRPSCSEYDPFRTHRRPTPAPRSALPKGVRDVFLHACAITPFAALPAVVHLPNLSGRTSLFEPTGRKIIRVKWQAGAHRSTP
jgi:hypothetical protein